MKEMEQEFYRDEFEQMLKDTTEDFRMYPSRKVWHSIYNDLHPDRRWPSFAVCLLLLSAILYIGVANNNSISKRSRTLLTAVNTNEKTIANQKNTNSDKKLKNNSDILQSNFDNTTYSNLDQSQKDNYKNIATSNMDIPVFEKLIQNDKNSLLTTSASIAPHSDKNIINKINNSILINIIKEQSTETAKLAPIEEPNSAETNVIPANDISDFNIEKTAAESSVKTTVLTETKNTEKNKLLTANTDEKSWVEDFAFHNVRNRNKWKSNLSLQYYITPSIGYRELYKNNDFGPSNGLLLRMPDNANSVSQQAAFNIEAGGSILMGLTKKIRLKSGFQINYSNYITHAHELQHPAQTVVLMNDLHNGSIMPVSYNSNYGNVLGSNFSKLNNKTLQISLPLGADYQIAGNEKIKWYMGATIQPTYILSGNAYLISTDYKNFVDEVSLLRNWNINTSIETFATINTGAGFNVNLGPQLRYQLLSTYSKAYTYTEKLYNIGFKLGITKKL